MGVSLQALSPLTVGKNEATQLEITQDQTVLVAVHQGGGHLTEERGSFRLRDATAAAHQAVQVPVSPGEEGIEELRAQQELLRPSHILVRGQP